MYLCLPRKGNGVMIYYIFILTEIIYKKIEEINWKLRWYLEIGDAWPLVGIGAFCEAFDPGVRVHVLVLDLSLHGITVTIHKGQLNVAE